MLQIFLQIVDTPEEKSKFEELYYQYKNLMFYVAKKILKDENLAEDAVNEAFLTIAKNFSKINEIFCPQTRSFVVIIVRNTSLNMLKKMQDDLGYEDDAGSEECGRFYSPEKMGDVFEHVNYGMLVDEIENLPEKYRDVLHLLCVEEYRYVEIATVLDISVAAAQKRAQRGREILIERIGERHD